MTESNLRRSPQGSETTSAAPSAGGGSFSWSFAGSLGVHLAIAGGLAYAALAPSAGGPRRGHVIQVVAAPLAAAIEPEPEPEPERELVLSTPDEPQLVEVDLPPQPLLALETPQETRPDVLDSTRAQSRLLSLEWSSSTARRAADGASGGSAGAEQGEPDAQAVPVVAPVPAPAPVLVGAVRLDTPDPEYPRLSRRLWEQGSVELRVRVLADGSVGDVTVLSSSGFERLDRAAVEGVRAWRFRAATQDGVPHETDVVHRFTFQLEGA